MAEDDQKNLVGDILVCTHFQILLTKSSECTQRYFDVF